MHKQILMAALPFFVLIASAQQFPLQYPSQSDNTQQGQSNSLDCSDPTMAGSPQCAGGQGLGTSQFPSVGTATPQAGRVPTYTDLQRLATQNQGPGMIPLPPEPLTEFQKFVASTTGQVLPIFGANLFQFVPSTFAPVDNAPVPPDYVLGPEDELRIRIWGQVNFNADVQVDRSGNIYLPQVGTVHVAGLHFSELSQHIHDAISRVYRNFQLQVDMGQIRSIQVYVTGEARRAGVYTVSSLSTLIDALFASGGPSVQGSLRRIQLRRNGQTVTTLDLYELLVNGDKSQDSKLLSGDVIYIPPVGAQAALSGSVRRQGIFELLPGETMDKLVHDAGGLGAVAGAERASVDRILSQNGSSQRSAMEIRLDATGMATPLENGDIINVLSAVTKFEKTVTLRGNTANPGRFAWHEGMKLSDLIPDRNSLLTRDYWWKRAQMGLPAPEFQPSTVLGTLRQPSSPIDLREQVRRQELIQQQQYQAAQPGGTQQGRPVNSSEDAYLTNVYPMDQTNTGLGQTVGTAAAAQGLQNNTSATNGANNANGTNNGSYTANGPNAANGAYTANGTNPYGQQQQQNSALQGQQSALAEEESNEPNETLTPRPLHRTVVKLNVPEIDWSYAVIERTDPTTLKTSLVPFDLGKLVNGHDGSQDLALQAGDVVTVFSQADIHVPLAEQTTFVRLEGEFAHSGTYSVQPGDTLRSLVERAGGLTPNAYLYGSVFTRESTRILQQRRIDESVHEMTLQMQRGLLDLAASPTSNAHDLASVSAAQSSEQALIAQLQQVRANGRIVLQFTPGSEGDAAIPDIKLENGDSFLVPSVPTTVNVLGAVFNQNSFVYRPQGDVRSFMDLAGGPNTNADRKRMFVVRANGAVVSRTVVKSVWSDPFMHLKLNPGDTVIVPEKTINQSVLRGILDWSQVVSQLAFGAAAINVLR
jgi:protein involved in polysaccharide export with SLBB domain